MQCSMGNTGSLNPCPIADLIAHSNALREERYLIKFKCRWNHLISVAYSEHAFCMKRLVTEVNWNSFSLLSRAYSPRRPSMLLFLSEDILRLVFSMVFIAGVPYFPMLAVSSPVTIQRLHFATLQNSCFFAPEL